MAVEIVTINPRSSGKKKPKKKASKKMAEKKKKKKTTKKKKKKNPSVGGAARAVGSRARSTFGGMKIKKALENTIPHVAGALAAKWAVKKFPGVDGGGDKENWSWGNYLAGGCGSFVAGAIAENVKRGSGQLVLEGGLTLLGYKLFVNEIAVGSEFLEEQFGADDEEEGIVLLGDEEAEEGDLLLGDDGEIYMMGADGYTRPVGEQHRVMAAEMNRRALASRAMGGELERPGALGGELERPGALGEMAVYPPPANRRNDPYMTAYSGRG